MQTIIGLILVLAVIIIALVIFYKKLDIVSVNNNDLIFQVNELTTKLALSNREIEFLNEQKQQLSNELAKLKQNFSQIQVREQDLYEEKLKLTNECTRLSSENSNLKAAYTNLEELLGKLRLDLNQEFAVIKERAIFELQNKANESLSFIGKQNIVEPLDKRLRELDEKIIELKKETRDVSTKSANLSEQANNLAQALIRDSQKKGEFGEMILANILEHAGLKDKISYFEQEHITSLNPESRNLRPDYIIRLPDKRGVVIDSKNIVGEYYRKIIDNTDKIKAVSDAINVTVKNLASKQYIDEVSRLTGWNIFEYLIMFIPNEGIFNLIVEQDSKEDGRGIIWSAYAKKIIIAGPSTILPLLAMIERMWQNHEIEAKILHILKLAYDLSDQFRITLERMTTLGNSINKVAANYDEVVKSFANGTNSCAIGKLSQLANYKRDLTANQPILGEGIIKRFPINDVI